MAKNNITGSLNSAKESTLLANTRISRRGMNYAKRGYHESKKLNSNDRKASSKLRSSKLVGAANLLRGGAQYAQWGFQLVSNVLGMIHRHKIQQTVDDVKEENLEEHKKIDSSMEEQTLGNEAGSLQLELALDEMALDEGRSQDEKLVLESQLRLIDINLAKLNTRDRARHLESQRNKLQTDILVKSAGIDTEIALNSGSTSARNSELAKIIVALTGSSSTQTFKDQEVSTQEKLIENILNQSASTEDTNALKKFQLEESREEIRKKNEQINVIDAELIKEEENKERTKLENDREIITTTLRSKLKRVRNNFTSIPDKISAIKKRITTGKDKVKSFVGTTDNLTKKSQRSGITDFFFNLPTYGVDVAMATALAPAIAKGFLGDGLFSDEPESDSQETSESDQFDPNEQDEDELKYVETLQEMFDPNAIANFLKEAIKVDKEANTQEEMMNQLLDKLVHYGPLGPIAFIAGSIQNLLELFDPKSMIYSIKQSLYESLSDVPVIGSTFKNKLIKLEKDWSESESKRVEKQNYIEDQDKERESSGIKFAPNINLDKVNMGAMSTSSIIDSYEKHGVGDQAVITSGYRPLAFGAPDSLHHPAGRALDLSMPRTPDGRPDLRKGVAIGNDLIESNGPEYGVLIHANRVNGKVDPKNGLHFHVTNYGNKEKIGDLNSYDYPFDNKYSEGMQTTYGKGIKGEGNVVLSKDLTTTNNPEAVTKDSPLIKESIGDPGSEFNSSSLTSAELDIRLEKMKMELIGALAVSIPEETGLDISSLLTSPRRV